MILSLAPTVYVWLCVCMCLCLLLMRGYNFITHIHLWYDSINSTRVTLTLMKCSFESQTRACQNPWSFPPSPSPSHTSPACQVFPHASCKARLRRPATLTSTVNICMIVICFLSLALPPTPPTALGGGQGTAFVCARRVHEDACAPVLRSWACVHSCIHTYHAHAHTHTHMYTYIIIT